jgi:hypothetical protein
MMRKVGFFAVYVVLLAPIAVSLLSLRPEATLKYKRESDKECTFCHVGIPRNGDEDPKLNDDGRKFKENGYQLTEDQKRRASAAAVVPAH